MKELRRLVSILACANALSTVACGNSGAPATTPNAAGAAAAGGTASGNTAGTSAAGTSATPVGTPLLWDAGGFVAPDTNPFTIQGPFYFYSDCDPPSGLPCTAPDASLLGADGKPGWSSDASKVCIKGTAVKVESGMFSAQWGAGLALDLNSKGGEPGVPAVKGTFDLAAAGITGFAIELSGSAPGRIRINLTMPGVADSNFVDAVVPGTTTFSIADAKQGSWVTSKTPLDPTQVEAMQFQVFTNAAAATPYDFCVDAIRALP